MSSAASSTPKPTQAQAQPNLAPKPKRKTRALSRWNDGKWYFTTSEGFAQKPPQFNALDGPAGWVAESQEPGTRELYACKVGTAGDYMTSVDFECDKQVKLGSLGWVLSGP